MNALLRTGTQNSCPLFAILCLKLRSKSHNPFRNLQCQMTQEDNLWKLRVQKPT